MCRCLRGIGLVGISLAIAGVLWEGSVDSQIRPKIGALLPSPGSAHSSGHTYYVATNGSNANPGTETQPFRTLARGVRGLKPGEILYLMSGTYAESLIHTIPPGTSWDSPVTVAAAPGHIVTLKPNSGADFVLRFVGPQQYIVIDGLILDATNVTYDAVKITEGGGGPAHHIRLIRCEVKNSPGQGVLITRFADWNELITLNVHDNGTTKLDHGFYISTSNNIVEGSTIHHNSGYGVHIYEENASRRVDHNIVRNNRIFDNGYMGGGAGIILGSGDGNTAYNNLIWGNGGGIKVAHGAVPPTNTTVYHNTVYHNRTYGIYVHADSRQAIIRNNLFYANGLSESQQRGVGTVFDHNLVGTDPTFVNAAAGDFHVQPGSSAIDAGVSIAVVTRDHDGTRRPQGLRYDIGAFEFADPSP